MKKLLILGLGLLLLSPKTFAQQDAQFTQFMYNKLFINPAFAGVEQNTQISFIHRSQWTGYQPDFDASGAPSTQVLSFQTAFPKFNSGLGLHVVLDRLGPLSNIEAQLSYAYHVKLSSESTLSFGLRGGLYTRLVDYDKYRVVDNPDPLVGESGTVSVLNPDMAIGVYYHSPKAYLGLSMNHLTRAEFDFGDGLNRDALVNSFFLMGGYTFELADRWEVKPNFLVKASEFDEFSFDVGALIEYDKKFWIGGTFRNEESINAMAGVLIPRTIKKANRPNQEHQIRLGFGFDFVYNGVGAKQATSYELFMSYDLPVPKPTIPAIIRTPRFRY